MPKINPVWIPEQLSHAHPGPPNGHPCPLRPGAPSRSSTTPGLREISARTSRGHYYLPLLASLFPVDPGPLRRSRSASAASRMASGLGPKAEKAKAATTEPSARLRTIRPGSPASRE